MIGLGHPEIESFRSLVASKLGLHLEDDKVEHLEEVLRVRMLKTGCDQFTDYLRHLNSISTARSELRELARRLTIGETYFFRHPDHFRAFIEVALPARLRAQNHLRQLRILSAGCASGEEPYTLATLIQENISDFSSWNITLLGIDINTTSLDKAIGGKYSSWSLRDTPERTRQRLFHTEGKEFILNEPIRSMVTFEERNLVEDDLSFWQPGIFDIIFCRNVLMYFSTDTIRKVVAQMARSLAPGGFLFLGPVETLRGISQKFHLCHTHETFYYQYRGTEKGSFTQNLTAMTDANPWPEEMPPPTLAQDDTWVDVICRASERIAKLVPDPLLAPQQTHGFIDTTADVTHADLELAKELFKQERYEDAMVALQKSPLELETNSDVCLLRAAVLTNRGNIVEAEKVCKRLLTLDELNAGAHYLKALCREHSNDRAAAIEEDQTALYLDSTFAMPHLHLGLLAKQSGDGQTAQNELKSALSLLSAEDPSRILLFGGGFSREGLIRLCQAELQAQEIAGKIFK